MFAEPLRNRTLLVTRPPEIGRIPILTESLKNRAYLLFLVLGDAF